MKKNKAIIILSTLLVLSSCSLYKINVKQYEFATDISKLEPLEGDNFYQQTSFSSSLKDMLETANSEKDKRVLLPSLGEQNILVLPVDFPDYPKEKLDNNNGNDAHKIIQNAFFGTEEVNQWESVASFYYQSSYGQLKIGGEVAPWYQVNNQNILDELAYCNNHRCADEKRTNISSSVMQEALSSFIASQDLNEFKAKYDKNNDGYVDAIAVIYSHPIGTDGKVDGDIGGRESLFWAYYTYDKINPNVDLPVGKPYVWVSYDFLYPKYSLGNNKPDAHTLIHEVGHLLGLEDYYNSNDNGYRATGGLDMMDYSLGDHTAFSKLLLNWVNPYIITDEGELTLRPFNESGDLVLLGSNATDANLFSEYLLLEFYTPTKMNYMDSQINQEVRLFNEYGLKVYLVNAIRRGLILGKDDFKYSNNRSSSSGNLIFLYHLLESSGTNRSGNAFANNKTLFKSGDDFGQKTYQDFTFSNGNSLAFSFKITKQTKTSITLSFSKWSEA